MSQRKVLPEKATVVQLLIQFLVFTEHVHLLLLSPRHCSNPLT